MRESDLLAFQIAIGHRQARRRDVLLQPVNGDYACENDYLLNQVLKKDLGLQRLRPLRLGRHALHRQSRARRPRSGAAGSTVFRRARLKQAVQSGHVPQSRLDDMVHRILRSMFAAGVVDDPPIAARVLDPFRGRDDAQHIADESIVLLKNAGQHPAADAGSVRSIARHRLACRRGRALRRRLGAGRSRPAATLRESASGRRALVETVYFPSSPLKASRSTRRHAKVEFDPGADPGRCGSLRELPTSPSSSSTSP